MREQLIEMLDAAEKFVRAKRIGSSKELVSMFDLRDADNNSHMMITPFVGETNDEVDLSKDFVAFLVRKYIAEHKITHYMFITEAWSVTRATGEYIPGVSQRPAESDDRREIILADAHDGTTHLSSSWYIKRNGDKCVDIIPIAIKEERHHGDGGGRFDSLLKSRSSLHNHNLPDDDRPA
jgi:hypothetical protein